MKVSILPVASLLSAFLAVGPALGQFTQSQYFQPQQDQQSVTGKIQKLYETKIRGSDHQVLLAQIETKNGQHILVDLGPKEQLKDLPLREGNRIWARGDKVSTNRGQVILAQQVGADEESVTVDRRFLKKENRPITPQRTHAITGWQPYPIESRDETASSEKGYEMDHRDRSITGIVEATRKIKLRDSKQENLLVKIKTEKGRLLYADLGPAKDLDDLNIQKGDRITAMGRDIRVQDKRILMAIFVSADGETVSIDRREQFHRPSGETQSIQYER